MTIYGFHSTGILLIFFGTGLVLWTILTTVVFDVLSIIFIVIGVKIIILTIIFRDKVRLDKL